MQNRKTAEQSSALGDNPRVPLKHDSAFYNLAEDQTDLTGADLWGHKST